MANTGPQNVWLEPGQSEDVGFDVWGLVPGTYDIACNGLHVELVVGGQVATSNAWLLALVALGVAGYAAKKGQWIK